MDVQLEQVYVSGVRYLTRFRGIPVKSSIIDFPNKYQSDPGVMDAFVRGLIGNGREEIVRNPNNNPKPNRVEFQIPVVSDSDRVAGRKSTTTVPRKDTYAFLIITVIERTRAALVLEETRFAYRPSRYYIDTMVYN
jgi:hypothetical protein